MASSDTVLDRETVAQRLLRTSARHSFDPAVDVDWDQPPVPGAYYCSPTRCSLYGTALWDGLSEAQRVELSKHEVMSIASVGIWFELILMELLIRHAYHRDPLTRHVQYALSEVGDECHHSTMFARMIAWAGTPAYGPGRRTHRMGTLFKAITDPAAAFAATLFVEEVLDSLQREAMRDESLQPLVRTVSRIHVIEESRHVHYATAESARQWSTPRSRLAREASRWLVALVAVHAVNALVHPRVYAAVGLDPAVARQAARTNPTWRATQRWAARKAVAHLEEIGMIGGPSRRIWRRLGLLD